MEGAQANPKANRRGFEIPVISIRIIPAFASSQIQTSGFAIAGA
jgi:hypothetical protein